MRAVGAQTEVVADGTLEVLLAGCLPSRRVVSQQEGVLIAVLRGCIGTIFSSHSVMLSDGPLALRRSRCSCAFTRGVISLLFQMRYLKLLAAARLPSRLARLT